ncbi:hypothetical protein HY623_00465 [Candidatus Uhrbacteria bacterium]|nr:hypothetical protein [Candidatus Uhrbacteria bacterium]
MASNTIWRGFLTTIMIGLVLFVANYHVPLSGTKTITYDFRGPDGTISHAYPVARVRDMARQNGRTYRPMIEDPVYVDVKTLLPYRVARIDLIFQNTTSIPLAVGMKRAGGTPSFDLKSVEEAPTEGGWSRGSVLFDLSTASYYNGKYTFAFSVPGLRTERPGQGEVRLSQMRLILERPPLSWDDILTLWKNF